MSDDNNGAAGANSGMELDESKLPKFSEIDENNATPEQVKELKESAQTLLGKTKHWSGKAKTLATELEEAKKNPPKGTQNPSAPAPEAPDVDLRNKVNDLVLEKEKRQFGHANSLTPEETDNLFAYAIGMGLKPAEAMQHPFFKNGLEALRQQNKTDGATPGPSRRAPVVEGKTFQEMTIDERRKNFGKVVDGTQKRR